MKKIISAAFLFLLVTSFSKAQPTSATLIDPNAPVLKFEKDTVDFKVIENNADGWRTLRVKNEGKSPLIIQNVHGECGCTTADSAGKKTWTNAPIAPGKTGYIKVHYDTKRTGIFSKKVFVESNAQEPSMVFYIRGEVKAPGEKVPTVAPVTVKQPAKKRVGTAKKATVSTRKPGQ